MIISDLENMVLGQTRGINANGFAWWMRKAEDPDATNYGYILDHENNYIDRFVYDPGRPVQLKVYTNSEPPNVQVGDYVEVTYDGGQTLKIYPGAMTVSRVMYVDSEGNTYNDEELCSIFGSVPTPPPTSTPYGYKTPASPPPTPTPTPSPAPTSSAPPTQIPTPSLTPTFTPSPTPFGYKTPIPTPSSIEMPEKIAIFVRTSDFNQIQSEINTYISDVESRFYVQFSIQTGEWTTAPEVKEALKTLYIGPGLSGAILVGRLPYAVFHSNRVIPVFYEDLLDGEFLDNGYLPGSLADDGVYDYYDPHYEVKEDPLEIWVTFLRPQNNDPDYISTLRNFFDRTHQYYLGNSLYPRRSLIQSLSNYAAFADPESAISMSLRESYQDQLFVEGGTLRYPYLWDYLRRLSEGMQFVFAVSHGGGGSHQGLLTCDIEGLSPPRSLITASFSCQGANFHGGADSLAIGYVMGNSDVPTYSDGQAFIGCADSIGLDAFHILTDRWSEGATLGNAYFSWLKYVYDETRCRSAEGIFIPWDFAFIGNPFLRLEDIKILRLEPFFVYTDYNNTTITIRGEGFSPNVSLRLHDSFCTILSAVPHRITAKIPPGLPAGRYHLTATNPDGASVTWTNSFFVITYGDSDGDNLSDYDEVNLYLTNPFSRDTDGDLLDDDIEISGAANIHYTYRPTDPCDPDSDEDQLTDWEEINGELLNPGNCGYYFVPTDPTDFDTDNDGWTDAYEVITGCHDPTVAEPEAPSNPPYSSDRDTDGDGLSDEAENYYYKTFPAAEDSDLDGLNDFEEANFWINHIPPINPFGDLDRDGQRNIVDIDSDNDGLFDGLEYAFYGTDPGNDDTDGDGMPDGWEIYYGLNPLVDDAAVDADGDGSTNLEEYLNGTEPMPPPPSPQANVYYVDGINGNNAFDGHNARPVGIGGPWKTLSHAVLRLSPGDVCWVRHTTYPEYVWITSDGAADNPITLKGDWKGEIWPDSLTRPIVTGSNRSRDWCIKVWRRYWIIENFELTEANYCGLEMAGIGHHIKNCISHNNGRTGFHQHNESNGCIIEDCVAYNNYGWAGILINGYEGGLTGESTTIKRCISHHNIRGIYLLETAPHISDILIESSLIYENSGDGIYGNWRNLTAVNCTIVGNGSDGFYSGWSDHSTAIYNCIITNNAAYGIYDSSGGLLYTDFNCLTGNCSGNWGGNALAGSNSITDDPLYVDRGNNDYHIQDSSPCRGAGTIPFPDIDLDRTPYLNPPSMGAYGLYVTPTSKPTPPPTLSPSPTATPVSTVIPHPSATATPPGYKSPTPIQTETSSPTPVHNVSPTPAPSPAAPWIHDYNGDGTSDIAVFRPSSGLWAVRCITRAYFGKSSDHPVPGDYTARGTTDLAIFRETSGLWAVRGVTRAYFGASGDIPVPRLFLNPSAAPQSKIGIFRPSSRLWAIRGMTRTYFGGVGDIPVPGYYGPGKEMSIGIFRSSSGLWAIRGATRAYFGRDGDTPIPGDYDGAEFWSPAIFRPTSGLWAARGVTRAYFGASGDLPVPGGYSGDGTDDIGIFRGTNGLWAIRGVTRTYFGSGSDVPVTR